MTQVATVAFALGILGLFRLNRDPNSRTSKALWIPVVWLSIAGSRSVSQWLQEPPGISFYLNPEGSILDQTITLALIAFAISVLITRGPQVRRLLRSNGPILLFLLYCAVSILWSEYPAATFKRWLKALGDLLMVLVILTDPDPIAAVERALSRVSSLLLPLSILLIKYYPERGRYYSVWEGIQFYSGVATDKNMLGMTCLAFGLVSAWRITEELWNGEPTRRTRLLVLHGSLLFTMFWLFKILNSMTSLFSFLIATGLITATRLRFTRKPWVMHLLLAVVLLFTSSILFFDLGSSLLSSMGRDPTLTGRTQLWIALVEMNPSPILGPGFETFWLGPRLALIARTVGAANEAHNGYLEVFLNLGWLGVAFLAFVIATGYRNVIGSFRGDPQAGRLWLAYFFVGIVYSFTEAGFRTFAPIWITFLLAIIGSASTLTRTWGASKSVALAQTGNGTISLTRG